MECQGFLHTCRKCKKRWNDWDKTPICDCGEDRKCHNDAVQGWTLCDRHGGPAPSRGYYGRGRGLVSGTDSQFPLVRLASKYQELVKNGQLLSNRAVIEVIQTRILQLAERIDINDAPDRLANLQKLWSEYRECRAEHRDTEAVLIMNRVDAEFEAAYHDYAAWKQMFDAIDLHRKTVETEVKIAKDLHGMMTAEQGYELVAKLLGIILEVETDPKKLKRYQYEFTRLVGEESDLRAGRGSREIVDSRSSNVD